MCDIIVGHIIIHLIYSHNSCNFYLQRKLLQVIGRLKIRIEIFFCNRFSERDPKIVLPRKREARIIKAKNNYKLFKPRMSNQEELEIILRSLSKKCFLFPN